MILDFEQDLISSENYSEDLNTKLQLTALIWQNYIY